MLVFCSFLSDSHKLHQSKPHHQSSFHKSSFYHIRCFHYFFSHTVNNRNLKKKKEGKQIPEKFIENIWKNPLTFIFSSRWKTSCFN